MIFRQTTFAINTPDETFSMYFKTNEDALKNEENRAEIFMDVLDKDLTEAKIKDGLISNNPDIEIDISLDLVEFEYGRQPQYKKPPQKSDNNKDDLNI